jgi:hypothetical protein
MKCSNLNVKSKTKLFTLLVLPPDRGKQLYLPCTVLRAPEEDGRHEKVRQSLGMHATPRGRWVDNDKHRPPEWIAHQVETRDKCHMSCDRMQTCS